MIPNVLSAFIDHPDAFIFHFIFRIENLKAFRGIKGNTVIFDTQNNIILFVNDADIDRVRFFILFESMFNHIRGHFLKEEPGKISGASVNSVRITEIDHLLGNDHYLIKIFHADIDAFIFTDAEIIRDHHEFFHIPGELFAYVPGISNDRDRADNAVEDISDINAIHFQNRYQQSRETGSAHHTIKKG